MRRKKSDPTNFLGPFSHTYGEANSTVTIISGADPTDRPGIEKLVVNARIPVSDDQPNFDKEKFDELYRAVKEYNEQLIEPYQIIVFQWMKP